jgi:branched-chain amino acid transport system permease protein
MNPFSSWSLKLVIVAALVAALALVPILAIAFSAPFYTALFTRLIILAIAATSLNLILGFGGMISFGHAAFLGIGAYAVGIPAYYESFNGYWQFGLAIFFSALYALVTGAISLRTKGVHFIMITLAFSQMLYFAVVSVDEYGGDDGMVIFSRSDFGPLGSIDDPVTLYYVSLVLLLGSIYLVHRIVNSRFGMVVRGAKTNEQRMQAVGFNTYAYKLTCYVIAGVMAGIAGALLGNFTNFISPEMMNWVRSGELIFMVILGGAGSIFGPLLGASAFLLVEEALSLITIYWQLPFGIILILVVLYVRGGLDGLLTRREAQRG